MGMVALRRFKKALARGEVFPPFIFISITSRCNLRCQGCWVAVDTSPPGDLSPEDIGRVIAGAKTRGCRFFGLLGGEPMLHPRLWEILERHRDCYFLLFINGTVFSQADALRLRRLGNVSPLISVEGSPEISDVRRGGSDIRARSFAALDMCRRAGLVTGVATSLCGSNIDDLLTEEFLDELIARGALYMWYYIYRPAGASPCPELALSRQQILSVRKFLVEMRCRKPIMLVDSYWDHEGRALCPAAAGISHHISPWGDIEPCPPIQFAAENIRDNDVAKTMLSSEFLASFRREAARATRGCILLDDPARLAGLLRSSGARPTSRRGGIEEIEAMVRHASHDLGEDRIQDRHFLYRLAKRFWFFGFGAYG
jgi:MoaA/NifB/PqqE/SkfB family radical SAM enzyme